MAIPNLYSRRQKLLKGEINDILTYDEIPSKLRKQIIHIVNDSIGELLYRIDFDHPSKIYNTVYEVLDKEHEELSNFTVYGRSAKENLFDFLQNEPSIDLVLDLIELFFSTINGYVRRKYPQSNNWKIKQDPDDAIEELNERFKEFGIGYSYNSGNIIRIDSTIIHEKVTKPTLHLLNHVKFIGANEEYLNAHEHYKYGRNKECLNECLKAFESVLKIICKEKNWEFKETDTSKKLIQVCFQNNLIPTFSQNQFTSLQNLLESGIPTIRNKVAAHGQGNTPTTVSNEMTRYGLNLTGTNIIFLIEQSGI